jgi:hypothetical protein
MVMVMVRVRMRKSLRDVSRIERARWERCGDEGEWDGLG